VFESKVNYQGALSQIQDQGGRRLTRYTFPYQDGQTTDDLGRKGQTYVLNILFFGNRYLQGYKALFKELQQAEPGDLIHPVFGLVTCKMEDFTIMHESQSRKAMAIQLTLVEHNFTINDLDTIAEDDSSKSAIAAALQVFEDIDAMILKVQGTLVFLQSVKASVLALINNFKANYAKLLGKMNTTFNPRGSSQDIPALVPVNNGGLQDANGNTVGSTFRTVASPDDPFQAVPLDEVADNSNTALAVAQLEKEVNNRRDEINVLIQALSVTTLSCLEFNQQIIDLKVAAVRLQDILEKGRKSSKATLKTYVVPRLMTIREVAFENGIDVNQVDQVELLNPELGSVNYIPKGTVMRLAV
jgi:hypothetical protein